MAITQDIDVSTLNNIIKKSLIGVKPRDSAELLDKKAIVQVSNTFTTLQNAFNKIYTYTLNVKNIQKMEERRLQNIKKEVAMETKLATAASNVPEQAEGVSGLPDLLKFLTKSVTDLNKQIEDLDLTPQSDVSSIGDIDGRRSRGRGRARGLRIGGGILGAAGLAFDVISRVGEGQSAGQVASGVGGGLAGGFAGSKLGGMIGTVGGPVGRIAGSLIGGALGYMGGSALGDTLYNKMASTQPLGSTSFSGRFANYISQSIENMTDWVATAKSALTDITVGAGNIVGRMLDLDVGQGKGSSENAEKAMKYFMSQGWTREQAAGIVGNLQNESGRGLDPNAFRANDAGAGKHSRGIAQWNKERLDNLNAFAKKIKRPWNDLQTQLEFVQYELNQDVLGAGKKLRAATTVEDATLAITSYERFAGWQAGLASPETRKRVANARALAGGISGAGIINNPLPTGKYSGPGLGLPREGGKRRHQGLDIFAPIGTPVKAMTDGVVVYSKRVSGDGGGSGFGIAVQIEHSNGVITKYAHLSSLAGLKPGDEVTGGQTIGYSGDTGNAKGTPPHLHFEVWQNGKTLEPANVLAGAVSTGMPEAPTAPPIKPVDSKWAKALTKVPLSPPPKLAAQTPLIVAPPAQKPKFSFTGSQQWLDIQIPGR